MKDALREKWKKVRQSIPSKRRVVAEAQLFEKLATLPGPVLSFFSFKDEISTFTMNEHFASQRRLYLPKVHERELRVYFVQDPDKQCTANQWGILEPNTSLVEEAQIKGSLTILVPGLAFDTNHHRLGYGKGYYDRFLASIHSPTETIGIGFQEQFSSTPLPIESHDISLDRLLLF